MTKERFSKIPTKDPNRTRTRWSITNTLVYKIVNGYLFKAMAKMDINRCYKIIAKYRHTILKAIEHFELGKVIYYSKRDAKCYMKYNLKILPVIHSFKESLVKN